jgi:hypothetical protein
MKLFKFIAEASIPGTGCLLESIQSLVKFANERRMIRISIARWLSHINFFLKNTMQESILYIKLS